jgi:4-amino-4-deoxy-L-arabinose transferase-like glycosyltransferase
MLGHPLIDYLIPKINGDIRLQKPPLTYWMTALSYYLFGISESTGRIPTAICGWFTLAITYCAAKWLFGPRCGLLSAASLLGSYYFARHSRLAETDIPATLFVTLAIYAFWRASSPPKAHGSPAGPTPPLTQSAPPVACDFASVPSPPTALSDSPLNPKPKIQNPKSFAWMHLAAFSIAMSILCKGGPGGFPIAFLVAFAAIQRSTLPIRRFILSGAPITLLLLAAPWFLFAAHNQGWATFLFELHNVQAGTDHGIPAYQYIPWFIVGTLPFAPLSIIAITLAARQWRNEKIRGLLIWVISIAVPLCLIGNKQNHYLIPLLPPVMILTGYLVDRWNNRILIATTFASAIIVPPLVTWLLPRIIPQHARETAAFVRDHFNDSPLCFYGPNESVPLCFNLKRAIPFANDPPELKQFLQTQPNYIIITITKDLRPASAPEGESFESLTEPQKWEDQVWQFYKLKRLNTEN